VAPIKIVDEQVLDSTYFRWFTKDSVLYHYDKLGGHYATPNDTVNVYTNEK
jgi:hypothetical protein